jgi:hypothetical protein
MKTWRLNNLHDRITVDQSAQQNCMEDEQYACHDHNMEVEQCALQHGIVEQ